MIEGEPTSFPQGGGLNGCESITSKSRIGSPYRSKTSPLHPLKNLRMNVHLRKPNFTDIQRFFASRDSQTDTIQFPEKAVFPKRRSTRFTDHLLEIILNVHNDSGDLDAEPEHGHFHL
jgi:hypothetical protein